MSGMPAMNFRCRVLCRMSSIVPSMAAEPPSSAINIRKLSDTRRSLDFAANLS